MIASGAGQNIFFVNIQCVAPIASLSLPSAPLLYTDSIQDCLSFLQVLLLVEHIKLHVSALIW